MSSVELTDFKLQHPDIRLRNPHAISTYIGWLNWENVGGQYQGPTSIFNTIAPQLQSQGVATVSLTANLPQYLAISENYSGAYSVLKYILELEEIEIPLDDLKETAETQCKGIIDEARRQTINNPVLSQMVTELESSYDRIAYEEEPGNQMRLPPEVEDFLRQQLEK